MRIGMAKGKKPAKLDRSDVTPAQARQALKQSADAMVRLIEQSLEVGGLVPVYHDVATLRGIWFTFAITVTFLYLLPTLFTVREVCNKRYEIR